MDTHNSDNPTAVMALWRTLKSAAESGMTTAPRGHQAPERIVDIARQGGAAGWQVEDLLLDLGVPWEARVHWRDLAQLAAIPVQTLFWKPTGRANSTGGGDGLTLPDLAGLIIRLESWGVPVDPTELVGAVLPLLKTRKLLTESELRVFWWKAERHRLRDLIQFKVDTPSTERGIVSLPSGHRAVCHSRGMVIAGPRIGMREWRDNLIYLDCWHDNCPHFSKTK
jgi:hypothetical protein